MEVVWLGLAGMIASFNIRRAKDEDGNEIIPPFEGNDGVIRCVDCGNAVDSLLTLSPEVAHFRLNVPLLHGPRKW